MAGLTCELSDIALAAAGCEEQFSGLGNHIMAALPEDFTTPPEYDAETGGYSEASFTFKAGKGAVKIRIKKQSAKIASTGNEGAKGYNTSLTFVIDRDVEKASKVLRIMKNRGDIVFFAERPAGGYYVVYDPKFGNEINNSYDSGDAPESESGHTVTVTANPSIYPIVQWSGVLKIKSEEPVVPES